MSYSNFIKSAGMDPRSARMISRMLMSGLLIGGAAGIGHTLFNEYENAKHDLRDADDDDTLKVFIRKNKSQDPMAAERVLTNAQKALDADRNRASGTHTSETLTPNEDVTFMEARASVKSANNADMAAVIAALAGGTLSYYTVRQLAENYQKKKYQDRINKAQNLFVQYNQQALDSSKIASDKEAKFLSGPELATGAMKAAPAVLAILSAAATYTALNRQMGNARNAIAPQGPKHIQIIEEDDRAARKRQQGQKEASVENDDWYETYEFLGRQILCDEKRASLCGLAPLINVVAGGSLDLCKEACRRIGFDQMLDIIESEANFQPDAFRKAAALTVLVADPFLGAPVRDLIVTEAADMNPMYKNAGFLPEGSIRSFTKMAAILAVRDRVVEMGLEKRCADLADEVRRMSVEDYDKETAEADKLMNDMFSDANKATINPAGADDQQAVTDDSSGTDMDTTDTNDRVDLDFMGMATPY